MIDEDASSAEFGCPYILHAPDPAAILYGFLAAIVLIPVGILGLVKRVLPGPLERSTHAAADERRIHSLLLTDLRVLDRELDDFLGIPPYEKTPSWPRISEFKKKTRRGVLHEEHADREVTPFLVRMERERKGDESFAGTAGRRLDEVDQLLYRYGTSSFGPRLLALRRELARWAKPPPGPEWIAWLEEIESMIRVDFPSAVLVRSESIRHLHPSGAPPDLDLQLDALEARMQCAANKYAASLRRTLGELRRDGKEARADALLLEAHSQLAGTFALGVLFPD